MKITIKSIAITDGKLVVEPTLNSKYLIYKFVQTFKDSKKTFTAEFLPVKLSRSLNANNYAWHIMGEISNLLREDKDVFYLKMLKAYGQSQLISVVEEGADIIRRSVDYWEDFGESVLNGRNFVHIKIITGSSKFDTREMSIFIDGLVSEAKLLDIETLTPEELSLLKSNWKE